MTLEYSKEVMKNFMNPKNMGEIKNPDGIGKVGNPVCGDVMWMYIKVGKENGKEILKDVKFKAFGCAAAIASSSAITQLATGKTLKDAEKIGMNEVTKCLNGLPSVKLHCSSMAEKALKKAIEDYEDKKKKSSGKSTSEPGKRKKVKK
jgi:nitrogen fixation protein NifU and related proteins